MQYNTAPQILLEFHESSNEDEAIRNLESIQVSTASAQSSTLLRPTINLVLETMIMGSESRKDVRKAVLIFNDEDPDDYDRLLFRSLDSLEDLHVPILYFDSTVLTEETVNFTKKVLCNLEIEPTSAPTCKFIKMKF